jgi:glutathione gamma-glutamylcysteinyltransferase
MKDIEKVLSVIFTSLPSNFGDFIKWIVEVRRQEDGGQTLSQEEKSRLAVKEEVLEQIQQSSLYSHVTAFLLSANLCCKKMSMLLNKEKLPEMAAKVCCQGAEIFGGKSVSVNGYCCMHTCVTSLKRNGENDIMLVSGTVIDGRSEQGLDLLVPSSQIKSNCDCGPSNCMAMYPAGDDVLTALLLALPKETWSGIKNEKLLQEMYSLV